MVAVRGKDVTRKGKSHSVRPVSKRPPAWFEYSPEEVEAFVIKLAKDGNTPSNIGIILRDQYGIPLVKPVTGKTITQIMREASLTSDTPEDLSFLIRKATRLSRHLERNKSDVHNSQSLELVKSKIRRLAKYYKDRGILPKDWKYRTETMA